MTDVVSKQNDVQPDTLPPRIQQVADILAESIARTIRESNAKVDPS